MVEFLNGQLSPSEVLAIEIKQYVGQGAKTLVPRVIGQTAQAQAAKRGAVGLPWDRERFTTTVASRTDPQLAEIADRLMTELEGTGWELLWGRGSVDGSCQPAFRYSGGQVVPLLLWTYGRVQVQYGTLLSIAPFDSEVKRLELRDRLRAISGVTLPDEVQKYPSFFMATLKSEGAVESLLQTWDWIAQEVKSVRE